MNIKKDIHCPHFALCSGCTIDEDVNHPPLLEEVRQFFAEQQASFDYFSDKVLGWRYRAKLVVRGRSQNPQIGLYEAGTHHVFDIPLCKVHHPLINQAVEGIKVWICEEGIIPYDEQTQQGLLRYLQCVVERSSGRVQLVLVLNSTNEQEIRFQIQRLWEKFPDLWHSIWINFNTLRTNTIFAKDWVRIYGEEYVWETLTDTRVCFHPANFAQANLDVFEQMLWDLKAGIKEDSRIVEYYAGVGVIGLCLAKKANAVRCCEINPFAEISFEKARSVQNMNNVSFYTGAAADHLSLMQESDLVIVDPPRKGLDRPLLKALQEKTSVKELWYISCGWPAFKRDCKELMKNWSLVKAKAYLFFPGTDHLEVFAKFEKRR